MTIEELQEQLESIDKTPEESASLELLGMIVSMKSKLEELEQKLLDQLEGIEWH